MYLPEAFRFEDEGACLAAMRAHPFATLVTHATRATHATTHATPGSGGEVEASHVPLLVREERGHVLLLGHVARDNPSFAHLTQEGGCEALAVFHGPHAYVSPSVYAQQPSVPTWNFVVVHARGRARLVGEAELRAILDEMVALFDPTGWRFDPPEDYARRMLGAIAGFELSVTRVEGKQKLSQNRPLEDQESVARWLADRDDEGSRAVAALMRERRERLKG